MTETLFYPVFVLAAWAMTATLMRPTRLNQLLLVGGLALAVGTRLQAVVLVPAFLLAVVILVALERRPGTGEGWRRSWSRSSCSAWRGRHSPWAEAGHRSVPTG